MTSKTRASAKPTAAAFSFDEFKTLYLSATPTADHEHLDDATLHALYDMAAQRKDGDIQISIAPMPFVGGLAARKTRLVAVLNDRPFLIDSIAAELAHHGLTIEVLTHPSLHAFRDDHGALQTANTEKFSGSESWLVITFSGTLAESQIQVIEHDLRSVIDDVALVTRDWRKMLDHTKDIIAYVKTATIKENETDRAEIVDFLQYLYDNNFTFIGARSYAFKEQDGKILSVIDPNGNFGIFADERKPIFLNKSQQTLPQDLQALRVNSGTLNVYKVNRRSTVHRRVPLDAVAIKIYDKAGKAIGEHLLVGLFTSVTYSRSVSDVPLIRQKVAQVIKDSHFSPNSHDHRGLLHILEKYPRDELFQMPTNQILAYAKSILNLQERQRVALYTRLDPFRRYISALVYVPRDRYETQLRLTLQRILETELNGHCDTFHTVLDDSPLARVTYIIETDHKLKQSYDFARIEKRLMEAAQRWNERLRVALLNHHTSEAQATLMAVSYEDAFPVDYQLRYGAPIAAQDIDFIEQALSARQLVVNLYRPDGMPAHEARLKVYNLDTQLGLSDILPQLENMGVRVSAELNFETKPHETGKSVWIQDFQLTLPAGAETQKLEDIKPLFESALLQVVAGKIESDPLNGLVLQAGLPAEKILILRAGVKYLVQTKFPFSSPYMMRSLTDAPIVAKLLVNLFRARFNPKAHSADKEKVILGEIAMALNAVDSLDQDRILRMLLAFIQCTVRTNFYQTATDGTRKDWVSFKIDSQKMPGLPDPRPLAEIFVYSPRMEGIHLRGSRIARGGIRWSDRPEDFRTEILGLMQAQMVKNAVIVPEGAKGGFILKRTPVGGGRDALMQEGIACYKYLVRGMLDLTDNLNGLTVIPPQDVIRHDGDDPYIVAAADKGTATFSDIANGLSAEYNFWLGDAFASGGSAGYDHKKLGITARGAWESVKRHFSEMGINTQTTPFTVIGVGDMGGDVFGNGMLLSRFIKLVGAFNHMHIFCDPNPDPEKTFVERKRLFDAVKGWGDYDTSLLSKGGRIYNRSEKSLELTPEIKATFGIEQDTISPPELIRILLKAECDLLFFGGIGTYIKGASQSHEEAGDKSNDALRVDANEIRAKVIGEGANLAVTRKARVEMGQRGIRLNADFIDNSGGVDCSDHEVNIKILLTAVEQSAPDALPLAERNVLLSQMTDEVSELVLRTNYQSALAISMAEQDAVANLATHARFIDLLEREYGVKRKVEGLPTQDDIDQRLRAKRGLTRPELGILISHAKLTVRKGILDSGLPDDPQSQPWLVNYFPEPLKERFAEHIAGHRLHREIIATQMAASIVNRLGPTFVMEMMEKTGATIAEVAKICFIVREAFSLRGLWHDIEDLDGTVPVAAQLEAMRQIVKLMDYLMFWVMKRGGSALHGSLADVMGRFKAGVRTLHNNLDKVLPRERQDRMAAQADGYIAHGLTADMAKRIANLGPMRSAGDIIRVAHETKHDILSVARTFYHLGDELHFDWLRIQARLLSGASHWQAQATDGVITQLYATQSVLVKQILETPSDKQDDLERLYAWEDNMKSALDRFEMLLADMRRVPQMDLAMITLAEQRLRQLAG